MKTITRGLEEYNKEIEDIKKECKSSHRLYAFMEIVRWLKSGDRLADHLGIDKVGEYEWKELVKALDREDELIKKCNCQSIIKEESA